MWKQFTQNGNYKWIDLLLRLVLSTTCESIELYISMRPIDGTFMIADKPLNTMYSSVKAVALSRFKVSNSVCVSKFKTIFEKGYTPNWITEVFKIIKEQKTNVTYLLEDRGKPIAEDSMSCIANSDIYLIEKVLHKKGDKIEMARI